MTTKSLALDLGAIKERRQKTWTSGDYVRIGACWSSWAICEV